MKNKNLLDYTSISLGVKKNPTIDYTIYLSFWGLGCDQFKKTQGVSNPVDPIWVLEFAFNVDK